MSVSPEQVLGQVDDVARRCRPAPRSRPPRPAGATPAGSRGRRSSPAGRRRGRGGSAPSAPVGDQLAGVGRGRHAPVVEGHHRSARRRPPPSSAASAMASASATVLASGFSTSTCLPASSAAIAISAWLEPGVQMSMRSTSSRSSSARQSVSIPAQPSWSAACCVRSALRPQSDVHARLQREVEEAPHGRPRLGVGAAHEAVADQPDVEGRRPRHHSLENAASKEPVGLSQFSFRRNCRASGAPTRRSMPASSHSTEIGPS